MKVFNSIQKCKLFNNAETTQKVDKIKSIFEDAKKKFKKYNN